MTDKLILRPRYEFSCEADGRDGWVDSAVMLEAELGPEHAALLHAQGLKAFVKSVKLEVVPYREVLQEVLDKAGVATCKELLDKGIYATDSEFVSDLHGFYGDFFDDVVWAEKGLVPPTGEDDVPELDGGEWPKKKARFTGHHVVIGLEGPPVLRCVIR